MTDNWTDYEPAVRDEIGVPTGDNDRVQRATIAAMGYVDGAIGATRCRTPCAPTASRHVPPTCTTPRDARLGVMDVGDGTVEPYRISTDPLRSGMAETDAVGVPTGGLVIA